MRFPKLNFKTKIFEKCKIVLSGFQEVKPMIEALRTKKIDGNNNETILLSLSFIQYLSLPSVNFIINLNSMLVQQTLNIIKLNEKCLFIQRYYG